jgi:drug/metabolite transporter (DMT)-like permease
MGKINITATQILATRFYLLVIASTVAFLFMHHTAPIVIDWKYYFLSSLIVVFFPLLMYQLAVVKLGSIIVSFLEPLTPVLTYFLQVLIGDYRFNIITVLLLLMSSGAVIMFVGIEQNIMRSKNLVPEKNVLEPTI